MGGKCYDSMKFEISSFCVPARMFTGRQSSTVAAVARANGPVVAPGAHCLKLAMTLTPRTAGYRELVKFMEWVDPVGLQAITPRVQAAETLEF